jgi:hypothetical protein
MSLNTEWQSRKVQAATRDVGVLTPAYAARAEISGSWDVEGNRAIDFVGAGDPAIHAISARQFWDTRLRGVDAGKLTYQCEHSRLDHREFRCRPAGRRRCGKTSDRAAVVATATNIFYSLLKLHQIQDLRLGLLAQA